MLKDITRLLLVSEIGSQIRLDALPSTIGKYEFSGSFPAEGHLLMPQKLLKRIMCSTKIKPNVYRRQPNFKIGDLVQ